MFERILRYLIPMHRQGVDFRPYPARMAIRGHVLVGTFRLVGGGEAHMPIAVAIGAGAAACWRAVEPWQDLVLSGRGGHLPQAPEARWGEAAGPAVPSE